MRVLAVGLTVCYRMVTSYRVRSSGVQRAEYARSHCSSVFFGLPAGMIGSNAARPTMPSGDWAPQSSVRVTCAATTSAMNRPIQGGMIRNPTASIPMRPSSQPGQRQMLPSQVMSIGPSELEMNMGGPQYSQQQAPPNQTAPWPDSILPIEQASFASQSR